MGFISDRLAKERMRLSDRPRVPLAPRTPLPDRGQQASARGGSYGASASNANAAEYLLRAMRSRAPGGWSDDRWEQTRHFVGITYICGHRLGEQLAQSEFQVFRKDDNHHKGKRPVGRKDEAYRLVNLLEKPNSEDSFGELMYRWNQQLTLTGTALTWMVPNRLGRPMELYPIPTALANPQPQVLPEYPQGYWRIQPVYPYGPFSSYPTPTSSVGAPIAGEWIMKFQYPHPFLRYDGYSPLTALRLHLDEVESVDRSRWYSMQRTVNPSAVLNFEAESGAEPLPEPEINRIKADFENTHMGPHNAGQLFVATPGAKLEPWGQRPVDMDYTDGWEQLTSFAMAGFGITKPAAGMIEDSSYASLFATLKQLHLLTLVPLCNRIAAKLTRDLAPFFGDDLVVEIRCPRIDDHDIKQAKLNFLKDAKALTKNEAREEMDMPLWQDERGAEIAGFEQPPEQPGMGAPGAEDGMPGAEQQGAPNPIEELLGVDPSQELDEASPEELSSPGTGGLGEGSMNPRKSLKHREKSLYDMLRKGMRNGSHQ